MSVCKTYRLNIGGRTADREWLTPKQRAAALPAAGESINRRRTSPPRRRPKSMRKHITPLSRVSRRNLSILGRVPAESGGINRTYTGGCLGILLVDTAPSRGGYPPIKPQDRENRDTSGLGRRDLPQPLPDRRIKPLLSFTCHDST
jgi:hypothetical protein